VRFFFKFNRASIKRTTLHIFLTYFSPPLHFRHPRISQLFFESKPVLYFPTATVPDANGSRCREVAELTEWSEVLEELIFLLYTKDISRLSWNSRFFYIYIFRRFHGCFILCAKSIRPTFYSSVVTYRTVW
jgi:hypothetical protein